MEGGRVNFIPILRRNFIEILWNTFAETPRIV